MNVNKQQVQFYPSWDNLPTDILLLMFEYMPTSSLAVCMFVSQTWRNHVEYVLEAKKRWGELFNIPEFKTKCKQSLDLRQIYYNYILWYSFQKATIQLHMVREANRIKKINIYRDHLVVVTHDNVQYYDVKTFNVESTVDWGPCEDFHENDAMAVEVFKNGKYLTLQLLIKSSSNVIYLTQSGVLTVDNVICYKIHNDECHVLNHRNVHYMYTIVDGNWQDKFLGRYYGNPDDSCAINVFDNQFYLMLKGGFILWMDRDNEHFQKMTRITVRERSRIRDRETPRTRDRKMSRISERSQVIHRKMFLWCCMHDIKEKYLPRSADENDTLAVLREHTAVLPASHDIIIKKKTHCSTSESLVGQSRKIYRKPRCHGKSAVCSRTIDSSKKNQCIERYTPWSNPMNETIIIPYKIFNVSCMLVHGDILFLGHFDGTVELISSRDLSKDLSQTEPLRRFNIKDFDGNIADSAVLSIDVYEEEAVQHMFIATHTHVLQLHITHTHCEDYMWSGEAWKKSMFTPDR